MSMKSKRAKRDLGIYGRSARWYDRNSRNNRIEEMRGYARAVASSVREGGSILEIAPGPGYLLIELAGMGRYRLTGLDISPDFIEIAKRNANEAGVAIDFREGNVSAIPFPDGAIDFVVCTAAFKNFMEPVTALQEIHRVLRPGGKALIVDMNRYASKKAIREELKNSGSSGVEAWLGSRVFEWLRKGAYSRDEFEQLISQTPFSEHRIEEAGIGFYIHLSK